MSLRGHSQITGENNSISRMSKTNKCEDYPQIRKLRAYITIRQMFSLCKIE